MTCDAALDRHSRENYELEMINNAKMETFPDDNMLKTEDSNEVKPLEGSDPPLPKELQEWFDGWSSRRKIWYAKWNKWDIHSRRKGACERHDYGELVSITPDLLSSGFFPIE